MTHLCNCLNPVAGRSLEPGAWSLGSVPCRRTPATLEPFMAHIGASLYLTYWIRPASPLSKVSSICRQDSIFHLRKQAWGLCGGFA